MVRRRNCSVSLSWHHCSKGDLSAPDDYAPGSHNEHANKPCTCSPQSLLRLRLSRRLDTGPSAKSCPNQDTGRKRRGSVRNLGTPRKEPKTLPLESTWLPAPLRLPALSRPLALLVFPALCPLLCILALHLPWPSHSSTPQNTNILYPLRFPGFPHSSVSKESTCNAGDPGLITGLGRSPGERKGRLPTPVFWLGEFHRLYSSWSHKESDTPELLSFTHLRFPVGMERSEGTYIHDSNCFCYPTPPLWDD